MRHYPIVGGESVETNQILKIHSPYSGEVVREVGLAGEREIEKALGMAYSSLRTWMKTPSYIRQEILNRALKKLKEREDDFARVITEEIAKPIRTARGEVRRAQSTLSLSAEESIRLNGELLNLDTAPGAENRVGIVKRFPRGPVLGITPFNFPLNLVMHKVGPALAAGTTVIVKPPPQSPTPSLMLAEILYEAGLPEGVLSVIPTTNDLAEKMVLDPRIKVLSFTGSAKVGWNLKGKAYQKHVLLEMGGNAGVIINDVYDMEYAVTRTAIGGFSYSGQVCISVQRIYVKDNIYEDFKEKLIKKVQNLKIGDPMDEDTDLSVMISEEAAQRVSEWIEEAKSLGAKVLMGGRREGNLLYPTVLEDITKDMKVFSEEVFGPVVGLIRYKDFEEAIEGINDSDFGLQAGIFTQNTRLIEIAFEELEVGGLVVNDVPTFRVDSMPYGGTKKSGIGREGIRYAINEYTEPKLMVISTNY